MKNDELLEELLERVELLEKQYNILTQKLREAINNGSFEKEKEDIDLDDCIVQLYDKTYEFKSDAKKPSQIDEISSYIITIFDHARERGFESATICSGEIHRELNLIQRIPSVCNAMRKLTKDKNLVTKYEVLKDTPSHNSSTYTIKYYF